MASIDKLNNSNTFGQWIIVTNSAAGALNDLYNTTFTKSTGVLTLGLETTIAITGKSSFSNTHFPPTSTTVANGTYSTELATTQFVQHANTILKGDLNSSTATLNNNISANVSTLNNNISANVVILNDNISANATNVTTTLNNRISANVTILNNNISANVAATNNNISANVAQLNNNITANVNAASGVTAGIYGGGTNTNVIPVITFDNTGKATSAANVTVSTAAVVTTYTVPQRGTVTTDNDLSFNMNTTNNFKCTPTGTGALTFTNITAGQSGYILLDNSGGYAITAAATTKVNSSFLTTISAAGVYLLSYFSDGTNVYVTTGGAMA